MVSEFDKNFNVSYLEESLPIPDNKLVIKHCLCSIFVYSFIYFLLLNNPFFIDYFHEDMQFFYETALKIYIVLAPIIYFCFRPKSLHRSHNIEICKYFTRILKQIFNKDTIIKKDYLSLMQSFVPTYDEKQSLMIMFIKVFFGTLMVNSLTTHYTTHMNNIKEFYNVFMGNPSFNRFYEIFNTHHMFFYKWGLTTIYTIDLLPFIVGYLTEASFLKNKIKTVDTSVTGLFFCLMCYPPFNNASSSFTGWNQGDYNMPFNDESSTIGWVLRLTGLVFIGLYAYASVALGTKASNLTNRGIVSRFPYNIVRHPAYLCKNTFWLLTTIPVFFVDFTSDKFILEDYLFNSFLIFLSWAFWASIYFMRAITEEQHLMKDPDYQEYCKKVKWRFIPFVI